MITLHFLDISDKGFVHLALEDVRKDFSKLIF